MTKIRTPVGTPDRGNKGRAKRRRYPGISKGSLLIPKAREKSPYKKAFDLTKREGYTERVEALLRDGRRRGDPRATYSLATWLIHGVRGKPDYKKAATLFRQASRKGIREAIYNLAYSHEIGAGVKKSATKATELYLDAALKGHEDAISEVVRCVFWGLGIARSRKLAWLIDDLSGAKLTRR